MPRHSYTEASLLTLSVCSRPDKVVFWLVPVRSRRCPLLPDHHQCEAFFKWEVLRRICLAMKDFRGTSGSPGWGGARKISPSCPCLTAEALLSLCSFIVSSRSLFIMIYPQVISLLKAAALGSRQEVGCVSSSVAPGSLC